MKKLQLTILFLCLLVLGCNYYKLKLLERRIDIVQEGGSGYYPSTSTITCNHCNNWSPDPAGGRHTEIQIVPGNPSSGTGDPGGNWGTGYVAPQFHPGIEGGYGSDFPQAMEVAPGVSDWPLRCIDVDGPIYCLDSDGRIHKIIKK